MSNKAANSNASKTPETGQKARRRKVRVAENDVLAGRGRFATQRPGNVRLEELIEIYSKHHTSGGGTMSMDQLQREVVAQLLPGSRMLTNYDTTTGTADLMSKREIRGKIDKAMRYRNSSRYWSTRLRRNSQISSPVVQPPPPFLMPPISNFAGFTLANPSQGSTLPIPSRSNVPISGFPTYHRSEETTRAFGLHNEQPQPSYSTNNPIPYTNFARPPTHDRDSLPTPTFTSGTQTFNDTTDCEKLRSLQGFQSTAQQYNAQKSSVSRFDIEECKDPPTTMVSSPEKTKPNNEVPMNSLPSSGPSNALHFDDESTASHQQMDNYASSQTATRNANKSKSGGLDAETLAFAESFFNNKS